MEATMSSTTTTTTVGRGTLPAAGTWSIDRAHADVGFVGRHFGLTKIRGRFTGIEETVTIADHIESSGVAVTIAMATVETGERARDDHLRSGDFFDVDHHPTATFRSSDLAVAVAEARGRLMG